MADLCDKCWYLTTDDETGEEYCELVLDEDEYVKLLSDFGAGKGCKYYRADPGEYGIVRKQN